MKKQKHFRTFIRKLVCINKTCLGSEDLLIVHKGCKKRFIGEMDKTICLMNIYNEKRAVSYKTERLIEMGKHIDCRKVESLVL